ncbi:MAG: GreA/GreB family elongation factor [Candidatus Xiphinematobacter sp.]|nr:MAG: GreA/GreB family elongation factor [Candidatus Xiphinematobacter sp.]QQY09102.1 MAG: GreA/GreB family elongation factor [Candidatus Xiphinematobacter sp.]QQY11325.1 MAG: GreA/GreB family elongation factor [Candidatus Xiphinematobacter sp.]
MTLTSELQQAIEAGSFSPAVAESLKSLTPGVYCFHKSWGTGKIAAWRLATGQIVVDFESREGHSMQVRYATQTLQPLCPGDLRVRVFRDAVAVRLEAESLPVEFIRGFLLDHGGKATLSRLSHALIPKVFDAASFKRWWGALRKKLKSNRHFHFPSRGTESIEFFHQILLPPHEDLLAKFQAARHLKDHIATADQILKSLEDFSQEKGEPLRRVVLQIGEIAAKCRKFRSAQALELLLAREAICSRYKELQLEASPITIADILRAEETRLPIIFSALPSVKQHRVLDILPEVFGEGWKKKVLSLIQGVSWRAVASIARLFEHRGALHEFQRAISTSIMDRSVSQEILYWICRKRGGYFLQHLFNANLLVDVLVILERNRLDDGRRSRLHDLLLEDRALFQDLLSDANRQTVRDIVRRLLLSPAFDDMNRRSLLARIIKIHPEMQNMMACERAGTPQEAFTVSWISLERRKAEYDDLVSRQITQSVKDISTARSHGDLRENLEFKSAREQHAALVRRKTELELMLANARGTNFESPDLSQVSIGTAVNLTEVLSGHTETYSILGAWDGLPSKNIISYQAAMGRVLLGKHVGDLVELRSGDGQLQKWRIDAIYPFENFELLF